MQQHAKATTDCRSIPAYVAATDTEDDEDDEQLQQECKIPLWSGQANILEYSGRFAPQVFRCLG